MGPRTKREVWRGTGKNLMAMSREEYRTTCSFDTESNHFHFLQRLSSQIIGGGSRCRAACCQPRYGNGGSGCTHSSRRTEAANSAMMRSSASLKLPFRDQVHSEQVLADDRTITKVDTFGVHLSWPTVFLEGRTATAPRINQGGWTRTFCSLLLDLLWEGK